MDIANRYVPRKENGKVDFTPRRHHGFSFVIWLCGFFLPPLAVAVRFGIGKDFFINVILTILGYFPGHGHNFFIQNIRNNTNRNRTPKWAVRYGLVDDYDVKKLAKKRQWVGRYSERLPTRVGYEDDMSYDAESSSSRSRRMGGGGGGGEGDEFDNPQYYNPDMPNPPTPTLNDGRGRAADRYSIRPSRSRADPYAIDDLAVPSASASNGSLGEGPGWGERRARSKSRSRGFFGGIKGGGGGGKDKDKDKADRFSRSERVRREARGREAEDDDPSWDRRSNRGYHDAEYGGHASDDLGPPVDRTQTRDADDEGPEDPTRTRYQPSSSRAAGKNLPRLPGANSNSGGGRDGRRRGEARPQTEQEVLDHEF